MRWQIVVSEFAFARIRKFSKYPRCFIWYFLKACLPVLIVQNFLEAWNWRAGHLKSQWSQIILKLWMSGSLLAGQNCRRKSQKRIEMVACELENFGWEYLLFVPQVLLKQPHPLRKIPISDVFFCWVKIQSRIKPGFCGLVVVDFWIL